MQCKLGGSRPPTVQPWLHLHFQVWGQALAGPESQPCWVVSQALQELWETTRGSTVPPRACWLFSGQSRGPPRAWPTCRSRDEPARAASAPWHHCGHIPPPSVLPRACREKWTKREGFIKSDHTPEKCLPQVCSGTTPKTVSVEPLLSKNYRLPSL